MNSVQCVYTPYRLQPWGTHMQSPLHRPQRLEVDRVMWMDNEHQRPPTEDGRVGWGAKPQGSGSF